MELLVQEKYFFQYLEITNFLGVYENEGQVELHIDEGEKL